MQVQRRDAREHSAEETLCASLASPSLNFGLATVMQEPGHGIRPGTKQGRIYAPGRLGSHADQELQIRSTTSAQRDSHVLGKDTIGRTSHAWLYVSRYKIIFLQDARALLRYESRTTCLKRVAIAASVCATALHADPRSVAELISVFVHIFKPHGFRPAHLLHN